MMLSDVDRWSRTAEVVIVGYGMAGAVAAITAHDAGADVLILEKQTAQDHHTNSSMSGGVILVPADVDGAIRYMEAIHRANGGLFWTDKEIIRVWAEYASRNKDWIEQLGGHVDLLSPVGEHRHVPDADSVHLYWFAGMGLRMMRFMDDEVRRRNIPVEYGSAAAKLLTNSEGEIVGVKTRSGAGEDQHSGDIEATKAVVLTCGGFEFDEEMKLNYLGVYPSHFTGSTANTGDGIRMALDVGADLWHMNCCSAGLVARFPDFSTAFLVELGGQGWLPRVAGADDSPEPAGYIVVDRYGRRFFDENVIGTKIHCAYYEVVGFDSQRLEYPRVPSYWIFDQNRMEAGQLVLLAAGASGPQQRYKWSKDNSEELQRGWILRGESLEYLASQLGIQSEVLQGTVDIYNSCCQAGHDREFGREARSLTPLSRPPFYAVELWPGGPNTQGGPRRNGKAQVLGPFGDPIPRLYAAGELGSIFGMIYPAGGGNLSECIAFGRIAGENAPKEESRRQK